jgi:4-hydroxy-3-methylbut-2-en-1-yl diphosphate synthase IspG/GcpE
LWAHHLYTFQGLAEKVQSHVQERLPLSGGNAYHGFETLKLAVMGCIVNGPGESKAANIGISLRARANRPSVRFISMGSLQDPSGLRIDGGRVPANRR